MNNNKKKILFFLDLEGTILNEETGDFEEENLNKLLCEIDKLEKATDAKVNMHIVSPVFLKQVEEILDKIDTTIVKYNIKNNADLDTVESATAYMDDLTIQDVKYDRIIPFPNSDKMLDGGASGKRKYVKSWCEVYGEKNLMNIYCGNGRNDIQAMEYIKSTKKGFVVCPKNSRTKVRSMADFASEETDINGVIEGIELIVNKIEEKNKSKNKEEKTKEDSIDNIKLNTKKDSSDIER